MVEVPLDVARVVLDVVVNSLDWGSGFLSTEEMQAVGAFSRAIGGPKIKCRTENLDDLAVNPDTSLRDMSTGKYVPVTYVDKECVLEIGHPGPHEWGLRWGGMPEGWA